MPTKFLKNWERDEGYSVFRRVQDRIHPGPPLKERLTNSIYRIQVMRHRMDDTENRLTQKDKDMFNKCVNAQMAKQTDRAAMYANELAEMRKIAKLILRSQMALEQVELRLATIRDFGDVAVTMAPIIGIVHAIKNQLMGVMPEVSYELGTIGETLNSLVVEAGDVTGTGYDIEASSEEATKILTEANAVAEQKMKERFPELPIAVPAAEREKARSP